jgi:hypothetical protein
MLLTQYNFAEAANQPKETWAGNTFAALNRLKSGKFGDDLPSVLKGMSSAIQNNSKQWQIATGQIPRNEYEQKRFKQILQQQYAIMNGSIENPIGDAMHFENVKSFGLPKWAKGAKKVATLGDHVYFSGVK